MSDKENGTRRPEYAGPAFYNSPLASSLPIPKFCKRFSSVSNVILASGARDPRLDAITYVEQVPPDLEENDTKSKAVSVTSDIKPNDGKRDISAVEEQNKSADMKTKNSIMARALRSVALDKLIKRLEARQKKKQHQKLKELVEIVEIQRRQQVIIDRIESDPTNVIGQDTPQDMKKMQSQRSMIFLPRATPGRRNTADVDEATDRRERTAGGRSSEYARAKDGIPAMETVSGPAISASPHTAWNAIPVESEKTAFEDGGEANQETFEAKESEEAGEEAEDVSASEENDDEGHLPMGEMVEEREDEGYVLLQGTVGGKFRIVAP